jgi:hypothetical protein
LRTPASSVTGSTISGGKAGIGVGVRLRMAADRFTIVSRIPAPYGALKPGSRLGAVGNEGLTVFRISAWRRW